MLSSLLSSLWNADTRMSTVTIVEKKDTSLMYVAAKEVITMGLGTHRVEVVKGDCREPNSKLTSPRI